MPGGSIASNPMLVEKVVSIAREIGREIATPNEARELLSLNSSFVDRILI
jgi:3-keto-5-aminohexanoate cleavage enzyme